jgi:hypothetical protein
MLRRSLLTILVSLSLSTALPLLAQQPNPATQPSSSRDQNISSANETATGPAPLRETQTNFWDGDEPGVASLLLHPFARKKYVQRQLRPIRDRVNELDEVTASNSRNIKDIDARSHQGIQLASARVNLADQHSQEANEKAQKAQQTASQANTQLTSVENVVGNMDPSKPVNQVEIRFRPRQTELNTATKRVLGLDPLRASADTSLKSGAFLMAAGKEQLPVCV